MAHDFPAGLSYVAEAGPDCRIYRETSGRYLVQTADQRRQGQRVATLASAYAACQLLRDAAVPAEKPVSDLR